MRNALTATVERQNEIAIIHLAGDVTSEADEIVQRAYRGAASAGTQVVVFHFQATDYINSGGLAVLISIVTQARRAGLRVRATGLSAHFQKVFTMVGLAQYVEICQTLDEALTPL